MRLEIELVPSPLWEKSLRKTLQRAEWERLRAHRIQEKGKRCEICGREGSVQLHEIWGYDDESHVQRLAGFQLLCGECHSIKHFGRTQTLASEGKLDLKPVVSHFCKVNDCTPRDFEKHWKAAYEVWKKRSQHEWRQDVNLLKQLGLL